MCAEVVHRETIEAIASLRHFSLYCHIFNVVKNLSAHNYVIYVLMTNIDPFSPPDKVVLGIMCKLKRVKLNKPSAFPTVCSLTNADINNYR